jgi:hypothetical protein
MSRGPIGPVPPPRLAHRTYLHRAHGRCYRQVGHQLGAGLRNRAHDLASACWPAKAPASRPQDRFQPARPRPTGLYQGRPTPHRARHATSARTPHLPAPDARTVRRGAPRTVPAATSAHRSATVPSGRTDGASQGAPRTGPSRLAPVPPRVPRSNQNAATRRLVTVPSEPRPNAGPCPWAQRRRARRAALGLQRHLFVRPPPATDAVGKQQAPQVS